MALTQDILFVTCGDSDYYSQNEFENTHNDFFDENQMEIYDRNIKNEVLVSEPVGKNEFVSISTYGCTDLKNISPLHKPYNICWICGLEYADTKETISCDQWETTSSSRQINMTCTRCAPFAWKGWAEVTTNELHCNGCRNVFTSGKCLHDHTEYTAPPPSEFCDEREEYEESVENLVSFTIDDTEVNPILGRWKKLSHYFNLQKVKERNYERTIKALKDKNYALNELCRKERACIDISLALFELEMQKYLELRTDNSQKSSDEAVNDNPNLSSTSDNCDFENIRSIDTTEREICQLTAEATTCDMQKANADPADAREEIHNVKVEESASPSGCLSACEFNDNNVTSTVESDENSHNYNELNDQINIAKKNQYVAEVNEHTLPANSVHNELNGTNNDPAITANISREKNKDDVSNTDVTSDSNNRMKSKISVVPIDRLLESSVTYIESNALSEYSCQNNQINDIQLHNDETENTENGELCNGFEPLVENLQDKERTIACTPTSNHSQTGSVVVDENINGRYIPTSSERQDFRSSVDDLTDSNYEQQNITLSVRKRPHVNSSSAHGDNNGHPVDSSPVRKRKTQQSDGAEKIVSGDSDCRKSIQSTKKRKRNNKIWEATRFKNSSNIIILSVKNKKVRRRDLKLKSENQMDGVNYFERSFSLMHNYCKKDGHKVKNMTSSLNVMLKCFGKKLHVCSSLCGDSLFSSSDQHRNDRVILHDGLTSPSGDTGTRIDSNDGLTLPGDGVGTRIKSHDGLTSSGSDAWTKIESQGGLTLPGGDVDTRTKSQDILTSTGGNSRTRTQSLAGLTSPGDGVGTRIESHVGLTSPSDDVWTRIESHVGLTSPSNDVWTRIESHDGLSPDGGVGTKTESAVAMMGSIEESENAAIEQIDIQNLDINIQIDGFDSKNASNRRVNKCCFRNCCSEVPLNKQQSLYEFFHSLPSEEEQYEFLKCFIQFEKTKYLQGRRIYCWTYHLSLWPRANLLVCYRFLMNLFEISYNTICKVQLLIKNDHLREVIREICKPNY